MPEHNILRLGFGKAKTGELLLRRNLTISWTKWTALDVSLEHLGYFLWSDCSPNAAVNRMIHEYTNTTISPILQLPSYKEIIIHSYK